MTAIIRALTRPLAPVVLSFVAVASASGQTIDIGPAPGRMIDVSGRQMHFLCSGSGSPTVILEAGASSFAIDWSLVQPAIAKTTRVCSYDRAGFGWSGSRPEVDTPARVVLDLHAALRATGEKPPFVLVGASFGAMYVRLYQLDHPDEVAGLVFVDPATEDRLFTMFRGQAVTIAEMSVEDLRSTLPTSGTFPVRQRSPQSGTPFDKLPADLYQLRLKLDQRLIASAGSSVSAEVVRETQLGSHAAFARLLQSRAKLDAPIRNRPVVVLTRSLDMSNGLAENHAGLAALSTNSRHTVVPNAGHEIHLFAPAAVIKAIEDVVTASRTSSRLQ
jgi:pimeloyl-ACP methyl ester carboxylesterase